MFWLLMSVVIGAESDTKEMKWTVGDVERTALVYMPNKLAEKNPVVFAFHGHGGTSAHLSRKMNIQKHWPESIVVYMQGLPTKSTRDPEGTKAGWQNVEGTNGDRDLKFFDAVLKTLLDKHKADPERIYATGHSNGGGFTFALWANRYDVFAAFGPSAASGGRRPILKPAPCFCIAGKKDEIVPFENQLASIAAIKKLNGVDEKSKDLGKGAELFKSEKGFPVITVIHEGGHELHEESIPMLVKFFQDQRKKK